MGSLKAVSRIPEAGLGTVTSVALALPSDVFTVSGSPVTSAGTLSATYATQLPNLVWASNSSGATATPTFRALVAADLPNTVLFKNTSATTTVGYLFTAGNLGTVSSGTTTLAAATANYQYYTNNGAHTLAAPAADSAIDVLITNGASAGTITPSGFTVGSSTGDAFTTTNGNKFIFTSIRINGVSTYVVKALQ